MALHWAQKHRNLNRLLGDLLVASRSPQRALLYWLGILIGGTWIFLGVLEDVVTLDPLVQADKAFYHLFQQMRVPLGDRLMVILSELGDAVVIGAVSAFVALWLTWRRAWHDLGYWLAVVAFGWLTVVTLKTGLQIPRPNNLYSGLDSFSFPSGHATMSMVVYGFTAVLSAGELARRWRVIPYVSAALLISGISVSRLYLGAHWLSDVVGGLALGLVWVALVAIARQRHPRFPLGLAFGPAVMAVLCVVGVWHIQLRLGEDLQRYVKSVPLQLVSREQWWTSAWQQLPTNRLDLEGEYEQPLNIQWAGELDDIRKLLSHHGWHEPLVLNMQTAMHYLLPAPTTDDLPLLPKMHNGRKESLIMVHASQDLPGKLLVIYFWSSEMRLQPGQSPVWVGTLAGVGLKRLPLLTFPVTVDYDQAVAAMHADFSGICAPRVSLSQAGQNETKEAVRNLLLLCRTPRVAATSVARNSDMNSP